MNGRMRVQDLAKRSLWIESKQFLSADFPLLPVFTIKFSCHSRELEETLDDSILIFAFSRDISYYCYLKFSVP